MIEFNAVVEKKRGFPELISMSEMESGEIAYCPKIDQYVMKTLSSCNFEVMSLSNLGRDVCWTQPYESKGEWGYKVEVLKDVKLELILKEQPKSKELRNE